MNALTISLDSVINFNDEQFFELCRKNHDLRFEGNAQGNITIMSPVGSETSARNSDLNADLVFWNQRTKIGVVFDSSAGFNLPNGSDRFPDASWVVKERWQILTTEQRAKFALICPDFVIELMSTSDSLKVMQSKMQEYQDNGARLGWLINRKDQEVEIYRIGKFSETLKAPISLSGEDVLSDFVLYLRDIW